jgi:hypothetical protein
VKWLGYKLIRLNSTIFHWPPLNLAVQFWNFCCSHFRGKKIVGMESDAQCIQGQNAYDKVIKNIILSQPSSLKPLLTKKFDS